jgi:hypothetical protein
MRVSKGGSSWGLELPEGTDPAAGRAHFSADVDLDRRILHLKFVGAMTSTMALEYRRTMLAAFSLLAPRRPWGILSDRRQARVASDEVQTMMVDVFERATLAGRKCAAVLATGALTQLQMRRLALAANIMQRQFHDEASARAWLAEQLK